MLLARAPPVYVAALLRNSVEVLGEEPHELSNAQPAAAVEAGLREAMWQAGEVAPGRRERLS